MSREIRFRVWSYEDNEYRTDCNLTQVFNSMTGMPATVYSDEGDRFDIEQYTGLKDKNGKKIFEGDIVKMPDWKVSPKFEVVRFTKLSCGFEPFVCGCMDCMSPDGEEVEVIGNIHENKELLK